MSLVAKVIHSRQIHLPDSRYETRALPEVSVIKKTCRKDWLPWIFIGKVDLGKIADLPGEVLLFKITTVSLNFSSVFPCPL